MTDLNPAALKWQPTHEHIKSGKLYRLIMVARFEWEPDYSGCVYDDAEGNRWIRPEREFYERFKTLVQPPARVDPNPAAQLRAYLAALPKPTGPVLERLARALCLQYNTEIAGPLDDTPNDDDWEEWIPSAQVAIAVILAEIEAVRPKHPPSWSWEGNYDACFHAGKHSALDRLTVRLTGDQADALPREPDTLIASRSIAQELDWEPGETSRMVGNTHVYRSYRDYLKERGTLNDKA